MPSDASQSTDCHVAEAAREALRRYPTDPAMRWAWFAAASGLWPGQITPAHEAWADAKIAEIARHV